MPGELIRVEVCYAKGPLIFLRSLSLPAGATIAEAIAQSGVQVAAPEIDLASCRVGLYGKLKTIDTVLREHDRVEIYRGLLADPKDARRNRVKSRRAG
ncbi:MAG: RnfH family protein [Herminiimonas sp.]|nr:RnfH family protein [Herminiimonas sp.]